MILCLMAEGEVVQSIIIDKKDVDDIKRHIDEYNEMVDEWLETHTARDNYEPPSFVEWLDREKNVTTAPIYVGVISIVDGYWYT